MHSERTPRVQHLPWNDCPEFRTSPLHREWTMTVPLPFFVSSSHAGESGEDSEEPETVFRFFRFACLHFPRERGKVLNKTGCRRDPGRNADRNHAPENKQQRGGKQT